MGWSNPAMAQRYAYVVAPIRLDVARQVGGLLWEDRDDADWTTNETTRENAGRALRLRPAFPLVNAVAVGFEPTVESPPHTLSRSGILRSGRWVRVRQCSSATPWDHADRARTSTNETRTATVAGRRRRG